MDGTLPLPRLSGMTDSGWPPSRCIPYYQFYPQELRGKLQPVGRAANAGLVRRVSRRGDFPEAT